jgi:hypothetical protein
MEVASEVYAVNFLYSWVIEHSVSFNLGVHRSL